MIAICSLIPSKPVTNGLYLATVFIIASVCSLFALQYGATTGALARVADIRMVGPFIDRLHTERKIGIQTRRGLRQALIQLLPRLKASDASLLTVRQKGRLARHLAQLVRFQRDQEFQVVILRAQEQVGDAQAIPVVESIIRHRPHRASQEQVHWAAVECLPYLRQRTQDETVRHTLLRPTGQSEEVGGQLLRPAEGITEVDARELLRADKSSERTSP